MYTAPVLVRVVLFLLLAAALGRSTTAQIASWRAKLDPVLQERTADVNGRSRVIVRALNGGALTSVVSLVQQLGIAPGRILPIVDGVSLDLPHALLPIVAGSPLVARVSFDRPAFGALERTGLTVGAAAVRAAHGYDGTGIGIAVIDSGITAWHDDLAAAGGWPQRVDLFVDLVNGRALPYDDYGHGTHVAGIVAGNGHDSNGARIGIAPAARLMVVKALDASGRGRISDVVAALGLVFLHAHTLGIRVVNLSIAAGVYESYDLDPLTIAAGRLVAGGIVVVAAAGNYGRGPDGATRYGGITAPGNAPWVLTVGASTHQGTTLRADDAIAPFSSRGPAAIDAAAKPDLVAPGVGIESLSDSDSALYRTRAPYLLPGSVQTAYLPYLSLSGTSMAAPVVTGTVALMLQANRQLTPNQVKAVLQYTSEASLADDALTQGAGFLNAAGAIELARALAQPAPEIHPVQPEWSRRIVWGNQLVQGGRLTPDASAWSPSVTWGASRTASGGLVEWGVICVGPCGDPGGWHRWGPSCAGFLCSDIDWGHDARNVVWGTRCGGDDCHTPWSISGAGSVLTGGVGGSTVVWGTAADETVVWGTTCDDPACEPVIWSAP
jgi:serine protease AprX